MLLDFDLLEQVAARSLAFVSCLRISEMDNVVSVSYSQAKGEREELLASYTGTHVKGCKIPIPPMISGSVRIASL